MDVLTYLCSYLLIAKRAGADLGGGYGGSRPNPTPSPPHSDHVRQDNQLILRTAHGFSAMPQLVYLAAETRLDCANKKNYEV
jgi:hypothetical protein